MVGIRRALALLVLGFFVSQFAIIGFLGPHEIQAAMYGLALCYGLAFIGLAAEWFWARWFAMGVGNFGALFILILLKVGMEPQIAFFGFTHLAVAVLLMGEGMAARYEHSEAATERWNFHEESLILMRRAVKSAGSSLPFLILYALAPKAELATMAVAGLGAAGLWGLLRGRTWGALTLGAAGAVGLVDGLGLLGAPTVGYLMFSPGSALTVYGPVVGLLAAGLLAVPLAFARPMIRHMRAA